MVAPSWGLGCGAACVADMIRQASASVAANLRLEGNSVGLKYISTRIVNGFDRTPRYSFEFSFGVFGGVLGCVSGGGAVPLGAGPVLESPPSSSLVACAATCAMFNVTSCLWPPRSMVTVT